MKYLHIPGVTAKAEFSTENGLQYRYWLEIAKMGESCLPYSACVVMQNPSYACEEFADKSVQFMERNVFDRGLAEFAGVGRLIVVNQFARIQTSGFVGLPSDIGTRNDESIRRAIYNSDIVVVGWGSTNSFEERKEFVFGLLRSLRNKRLYRTKMHPSRGRYDGFILRYDV